MQIEVRCCCQPQKLLGWLPVPDTVQGGDIIAFTVRRASWELASLNAQPVFFTPDIIALPVAIFGEPALDADGPRIVKRLALKSEETPLERLRLIPGFREAP